MPKTNPFEPSSVEALCYAIKKYISLGSDQDSCEVIMLGGTAMYYHGVRDHYNDYDCIVEGAAIKRSELDLDREKPDFGVDFDIGCAQDYCEIDLSLKEGAGKIIDGPSIDGVKWTIKIPDVESLAIQKLYMPRDKDIEDLPHIFSKVKPGAIIGRINQLAKKNDPDLILEVASQAIGEMSAYQFSKKELSGKECSKKIEGWISKINLDKGRKSELYASFGIASPPENRCSPESSMEY